MNVLFLGDITSRVADAILRSGCKLIEMQEPIALSFFEENRVDFAVSYRYRHIVREPVITHLDGKIINLHISLLPWNRGADPNLWSFLEDTPKGVTIHYMDKGLDTGAIIYQSEVGYEPGDTLRTMYNRLASNIEDLFGLNWPSIMSGQIKSYPQTGSGSYHRTSDKEPYTHLLVKGWNTPVDSLIGKAKDSELKGD